MTGFVLRDFSPCLLLQDMLELVKLLQELLLNVCIKSTFTKFFLCAIKVSLKLQPEDNSLCSLLKPSFTLVGSVRENTRQGLFNELDLMVEFCGLSSLECGLPFIAPRSGINFYFPYFTVYTFELVSRQGSPSAKGVRWPPSMDGILCGQ